MKKIMGSKTQALIGQPERTALPSRRSGVLVSRHE